MTFSTDEADSTAPAPGGLDWARLAWHGKWFLLFGVVAGLVVGVLYCARRRPAYESSAQVMVIKKTLPATAAAGTDPRASFYEDYMVSHQALLRSALIVQRALDKHHLAQLETLAGQSDPAAALLGGLNCKRDGTNEAYSNILNLSFRGPVAADCPVILRALVSSYRGFLDETYKNISDETMTQVVQATESLRASLEQKEKAYEAFRRNGPVVYRKGDEVSLPQEEWLAEIQTKRLQLRMHQAEVRGRLRAVENAIKAGRDRSVILALMRPTLSGAKGEGDRPLEEQLTHLLLKEQLLLADFGPDHPEVISVRRSIGMTREMLRRPSEAALVSAQDKDGRARWEDPIPGFVESLKHELDDVESSLDALNDMADGEQKDIRELSRFKADDQRFRDDIAQTRQMFEPIRRRLEEVRLGREQGGVDARLIGPPGLGAAVDKSVPLILLSAGLFGLMAGFGLAYVVDLRDKTFRTPEEVRRQLGLSVLGHIPAMEAIPVDGSALGADLCTYHRPRSREAEAFRGLRTALAFHTQGAAHPTIQVTSPDAGDGKSALTANLAICIAQAGKRVLLIDADFRRPRQQQLFGAAASPGLAGAIASGTDVRSLVQATPIAGLSLLPCSVLPPNPAELLTAPRLQELLETLRADFDLVLIDTPPLLAVSDPSVLAPRVDGVVLTIRITRNGRPAAERASEMLRGLGARVLGVAVNDSGEGVECGYEGGYYSYGYSPAASAYLADDDAGSPTPTSNGMASVRSGKRPKGQSRRFLGRFFPW